MKDGFGGAVKSNFALAGVDVNKKRCEMRLARLKR